ncbi:MAG TPA: hypothetical protein VIL74_02665 [Pyrinomonadaceae bacterium]|jgi:hypothetical protein
MKIRYVLLFSPAGLALQVLLLVLCGYVEKSTRLLLAAPYAPWLGLGGILDRNSGAGGHAFAGGALLGLLAGVLVYSLLVGIVLGFIYERKIHPRMPFYKLK